VKCRLLVHAGRAELEAITFALAQAYAASPPRSTRRRAYYRVAHALHGMGLLPHGLRRRVCQTTSLADVDPVWVYVPKDSTKAQLFEAKGNLQRMLAEIRLTDDERAAVTEGAHAVDNLLERLADVPTPAGPTPQQLARSASFIPLATLTNVRVASKRVGHQPHSWQSMKNLRIELSNHAFDLAKSGAPRCCTLVVIRSPTIPWSTAATYAIARSRVH